MAFCLIAKHWLICRRKFDFSADGTGIVITLSFLGKLYLPIKQVRDFF
jgi:hypothetical protein